MIIEHGHNRKFKEWHCGGCKKLMGIIYADGTLAVKYKDLTAWVVGEYKTICRYCKCMNTYNSNKDLIELK